MGTRDGVEDLKPNRSEGSSSLSKQEQEKYAQQVQDFLKANTPVRALKPSRSEILDGKVALEAPPQDACLAEQKRFKELEADLEKLKTEGGHVNDDSYVETKYYDDLNSVDKLLHHKTGSGFISSEELSSLSFKVGDDKEKIFRTTSKTNPGTNEWQPSPPRDEPTGSKVYRSESEGL